MATIKAGVKTVAALAMPGQCRRCYWVKIQMNNKKPFDIFPKILNSMDTYQKRLMTEYAKQKDAFPPWCGDMGDIAPYVNWIPKERSTWYDEASDIQLTGYPDCVLGNPRSMIVIDFKSAYFDHGQQAILPLYAAQVNGYADIIEWHGTGKVNMLQLIYMQPVIDLQGNDYLTRQKWSGYYLAFKPNPVPIAREEGLTLRLLAEFRSLADMPHPPKGNPECKDCALLDQMGEVMLRARQIPLPTVESSLLS